MKTHVLRALIVVVLTLLVSCSDSSSDGPTDSTDVGTTDSNTGSDTATTDRDSATSDTTGTPDESNDALPDESTDSVPDEGGGPCPTIVPDAPPTRSGIAVVSHFHTNDVRVYDLNGDNPIETASLELSAPTHGMAADSERGLVFVPQDTIASINILSVSSESDTPYLPETVATIDLDPDKPRGIAYDHVRQRVYAIANAPVEGLMTEMYLYGFDVSDPAHPELLSDAPVETAVTTTIGIDAHYGLVFLVGSNDNLLYLYDVSGDEAVEVAGDPIDLRALYPGESTTGFQIRNVQIDPWRGRFLAGRAQGALSELMVLDYPAASSESCASLPGYDDFAVVPDFNDVSVPVESRDNLLDAYVGLSVEEDRTLFVVNVWNGTMPSAMVISLDASLQPETGCGDFAGFGCFYRHYFNGTPSGYLHTDGASCYDAKNGVFVGTSYDTSDEGSPGNVVFFRYTPATPSLEHWIPADGRTVTAGGLPVGAACL